MARLVRETEQHDFHFELGHLPAGAFELRAGTRAWALRRHTPESLAAAAGSNAAIGCLGAEARARITHYAEGVTLPADRALMLRVTHEGDPLPAVALLALHTPRVTRRNMRSRQERIYVPLFERAGQEPYVGDVEVSLDADLIVSPANTAAALVFLQPQLATVNPTNAAIVVDDHILAQPNALNIARLGQNIQAQGNGWMTSGDSTDHQGNTLTWGPAFGAKSGQPVPSYGLSAQTVTALATPISLPLTTTLDDARLQNSSWSSLLGLGGVTHDSSAPPTNQMRIRRPRAAAMGVESESSDFTLDNLSPGYGLAIDDTSLVFTPGDDGGGTLSINVMNTYLRSLWAWVQFFDPNQKPLGDYSSVGLVTPVNVVLGIPMPTDPTTLTFEWPEGASSAVLAHGGLGTSNWQNAIVWPGIVLTAVINYAIPVLFLFVGAALDNDAELTALEKDDSIQKTLLEAALGIIGSLSTNAIGFPSIKTILSAFVDGIAGLLVHKGLEKLQKYLISQLTVAGIEDAIPYVDIFFTVFNRAVDVAEIGETTVEVLCSPAVYEVQIMRSMPLAVTVSPDPIHGSLGNPAIWPLDSDHYTCIVQYQGGTSYNTTGPMLDANSSQPVSVSFPSIPEGGTLQVQFNVYAADDTLLGNWTSAWVPAQRPAPSETLSLSGAIQEALVPLTANTIYDYKEKLIYDAASSAHVWQPNQFALPDSVIDDLNAGIIDATTSAAFAQNGCPLSGAATVQVIAPGQQWNVIDGPVTYPLQSIGGDAPRVLVNTSNRPLAVLPLDGSDTGNNLGATIGITMNNKAYMLGYCWQASGQDVPPARGGGAPVTSQINTFQNINVLATPEAALKFSGVGYANQPFLVYDQFGPAPLFSVPSSYVTDLNDGTIPSDLAALFQAFGYPLPSSGVTVETVTVNVAWTISVDTTPTYSLQAAPGQVNVYAYPAVTISQNNFYLEPTSTDPTAYQYQLRQVVLDDSTPFDVDQTTSWGLFQLPHLSDAVVHPQGYVVGAHASMNMLEIVAIPAAGVPDASAQPSTLVGGLGTRPGLFGSPTALAVTADGRILVLEQANARVQAIDVSANPVACFAAASLGSVPAASTGTALDQGLVPTNLRDAFTAANAPLSAIWRVQDASAIYQLAANSTAVVVTTGGASPSTQWTLTDSSPTPQVFTLTLNGASIDVARNGNTLFSVDSSLLQTLDAGVLPPALDSAFTANGITLVPAIEIAGNGLTLDLSVIDELSQGQVPASLGPALAAAGFTLGSPASVTASVSVAPIELGARWKLADSVTLASYALTLDSTGADVDITALSATMPLTPPNGQPTYLGLATETKGYIYVLGYTGAGTSIEDFFLDIYAPDGTPLATTPGVNAGDLAIDMWRNLYTLNYESFLGPGGRTEPSISIWTPSV